MKKPKIPKKPTPPKPMKLREDKIIDIELPPNKFKVGDKTFEIVFPKEFEAHRNVENWMNDWMDVMYGQATNEPNKEEWTTIPALPQYSFKNLEVVSIQMNEQEEGGAIEMSMNLTCDEIQKLKEE